MERKFTDLTKNEITFIVNEIFSPDRITDIKVHKRDGKITCTIHSKWESVDDNGKGIVRATSDDITLRNPFDYGEDAICADHLLGEEDYNKLKSFCYIKMIYGKSIEWITNNPYVDQANRG